MSTLLAVDLGATVTGWSIFVQGRLSSVGIWKLKRSPKEHPGERYSRLRQRLIDLGRVSQVRPSHVAYEKVHMHVSSSMKCPSCGSVKIGGSTGRGKSRRCMCGAPIVRKSMPNTLAAHAYGATEGYLLEYCFSLGLTPIEVHTSAVKKAATGKGGGKGTKKSDILTAAAARWPTHTFRTDDAADAAFIGLAAARRLGIAPLDDLPLFK